MVVCCKFPVSSSKTSGLEIWQNWTWPLMSRWNLGQCASDCSILCVKYWRNAPVCEDGCIHRINWLIGCQDLIYLCLTPESLFHTNLIFSPCHWASHTSHRHTGIQNHSYLFYCVITRSYSCRPQLLTIQLTKKYMHSECTCQVFLASCLVTSDHPCWLT